MTVFVFLGPSLAREEAEGILKAEYCPPVSMGDLYRLAETKARAGDHIAIIDGLFEQVPAVWHNEILFALSRGIHVHGASSMGALRAAELHSFGMIGEGRVFEAYRDGDIVDDDEVAVAHASAEEGYRSLSSSMVGIRFALADMIAEGTISAELGDALIGEAKAQPYFLRNWGSVISAAKQSGAGAEICDRLRERAKQPDAKTLDARALLTRLDAIGAERPDAPHIANFVFRNTSYWASLTQQFAADDGSIAHIAALEQGNSDLARYYRAAGPDRDEILDRALLDQLVLTFTRAYSPSEADLHDARMRIAESYRRNGIRADQEWRRRNRLTDRTLEHLLSLEARRYWLAKQLNGRLDPHILARLKASGRYEHYASHIDDAIDEISADVSAQRGWGDMGVDKQRVEGWYVERFGRMHPDPGAHAAALGFETLRDFVDCILPNFLADDAVADRERRDATSNGS